VRQAFVWRRFAREKEAVLADGPTVVIHFKDVPANERLRESIERRCQQLADEFREATRFELTLAPDGVGFGVHAHVTGKHTDVGTHAAASDLGPAADQVLDKVARQLRRIHDKRIFAQRREAQRDPPKRKQR
jgi:ribosomal subunit interface protein